jgi:hypothetical protein
MSRLAKEHRLREIHYDLAIGRLQHNVDLLRKDIIFLDRKTK